MKKERRKHHFSFSHKPVDLPPSKIDLSSIDGKLYVDPLYGEERLTVLNINGLSLKGKWEAETEDVGQYDFILRFVEVSSGATISLTFANAEDRIKAVEALEADRSISHVQHSPKSIDFDPMLMKKHRRTVAIVSASIGLLSLAGLLFYRHQKKKHKS